MSLADKITQAFVNFDIINQMVNGNKDTEVQTSGGIIPSLARMNDTVATRVVSSITATSLSQIEIILGRHTFTIAPNKSFTAGQWVSATCQEGAMGGVVVSLSVTTLLVDVFFITGEGLGTTWQISLSGPPGISGVQGAQGLEGVEGVTGPRGIQGVQGVQGFSGETGATGAQGISNAYPNPKMVVKYPWEAMASVGTVVGYTCQGADRYDNIANGDGTSHSVLSEVNSAYCPLSPSN